MDPFAAYYKTGEGVTYLLEEEMWNDEYTDAMGWYDRMLRPLLEPEHNGSFVTFDWKTGDYALGTTGKQSSRILTEATGKPAYELTTTGVGLPHGHRWVQEIPTFGDPITGFGTIRLRPKRHRSSAKKRMVRRKQGGKQQSG